MKKLLVLILIVIIALAAFWVSRRPALKMPFADTFPSGAIGYVGVQGGAAQVRDLTGSNFWKKLSGIESVKEFTREASSKIEESGEMAAAFETLTAILGEEAAVACYGRESKFGRSVIVAARTRDLYSFRLPPPVGLEGAYAKGGGISIAAVSRSNPMDLVKAALDLSVGEGGKPLSSDKNFMALMGAPLRGGGTLVGCACFDVKTLEKELQGLKAAIVKRMSEKNPAAATTLANAGMGQLPCLSWGGYLYRERGLAGKLHMRLDRARLSAEQRSLLKGGVGKLKLMGFVPKGVIAVSDSHMGNLREVWKWYKTQAWPAQTINILSLCEKRLGIDFERDVLPWIGEEICLQLSDVATGGLLPVPRAQLVMSVKDRKAAERSLSSMMERFAQPPSAQTPQ
ncbi:MAG: hypothetical protein P8123_09305, partial [bacterium]